MARAKKKAAAKPKLRTVASDFVLAVDPGESFGAALFMHGQFECGWSGAADISAVARIVKFTHGCDVGGNTSKVVVVENQFVSKGKQNPKALATLLKRRHMWEIIAEVVGVAVAPAIYPASWQTILAESPAVGGDTKEKSMALAKLRWPDRMDDATGDLADAACMGLWYTRMQMLEHPGLRHARG